MKVGVNLAVPPLKMIKKRIAFLFVLIAIFAVILIGRMAYLQIFHSAWLKGNATGQRLDDQTLYAKRGTIYDRSGKALAVSAPAESVYAVPNDIKNPEQTAAQLAEILNIDAGKLTQRFKQGGYFSWVQRLVTDDQAKAIRSLNLPGIMLTKESKRRYPNGNLAAHVLGFVGIDNQGLDGIELAFEPHLKGTAGRIILETDPGGHQLPNGVHGTLPSQDGQDVYLTIDQTIQFIVERKLDKAMRETQAKAATIIAMNPRTGEILALANRPDYQPETYDNYPPLTWRNNAVSNVYEPGSTFKIVTAAAALQERVVKLDEHFVDPGFIEVQGRQISNWDGHEGGGEADFVGLVKKSSNYGLATVGMRLGPENFYKYLEAFGFGKITNVDLPGESAGMVIPKKDVRALDIATMSIGQSIAVTPLQLLSAVCSVANDGVMLKPQIIKEIHSRDGQLVKAFKSETVRQVIDSATAQDMRYILEKVISEGGAGRAAVPGYKMAGKTGTAQKIAETGGYENDKYIASFVGFGPLEEAPVALLVVLYEPKGRYYGGEIAAPIFSDIMREIIQYYNISPSSKSLPVAVPSSGKQVAMTAVPSCLHLPASEAGRIMRESGFLVKVEGNGENVSEVVPPVGSKLAMGSTVTLYTGNVVVPSGETSVPYLVGKTMREAGDLLAQTGLNFYPVGSGLAVQQEPAMGTKIKLGTTVTVYFEQRTGQ